MKIILAWLCSASYAFAATYFVDQTGGNDSNNGSSSGTAWKTLTHVEGETFSAGDTVKLKRGETWTGAFVFPSDGLILDAYGSGALPIIDGQLVTRNIIRCGTHFDTITRNIHIKNGGPFGGQITGANWSSEAGTNTIEDCVVENHATDSCIAVGGDGHIIVRRCVVTGGYDEGFTMHGTSSGLVENCTLYNNTEAINNSGTDLALTVNSCTFYDNGNGTGGFGDLGNLSVCVSTFNRCRFNGRSDGAAFKFYTGAAGSVTFNYCIFDASHSVAASQPGMAIDSAVTFQNCTLYGGSGHGSFSVSPPGVLTMKNCILDGWWRLANIFTGGVVNTDSCIFHNLSEKNITSNTDQISTADPLFVNPLSGSYMLQAASPAINAGKSLGLTADFTGAAVASPPEVGVYEFIPIVPPAAPRNLRKAN